MSFFKKLLGMPDKPLGGPDDFSTALNLHKQGQYREALVYADACAPHAPELGLLWRLKGECHVYLGAYEQAIPCLEKTHALGGPEAEEILLWKSMAEANLGRWSEAKETVARWLKELPPDAVEQRAKAQNALARYESDQKARGGPG
jgi:tetratricopeptide (TPR) repeat protein